MGTNGSTVLDSKIIILLAIKEREKQIELIAQVVTLIQDGDFLSNLVEATQTDDAFHLIHTTLLE